MALDPGAFKCGWAIQCQHLHSPLIGVVYIDSLEALLRQVSRFFGVRQVVVGGGTGSGPVLDLARRLFPPTSVTIVEEARSTEEALRLYLRHRGRSWLGRLFRLLGYYVLNPPLDGYAAWVLLGRGAAPKEGYPDTGLP